MASTNTLRIHKRKKKPAKKSRSDPSIYDRLYQHKKKLVRIGTVNVDPNAAEKKSATQYIPDSPSFSHVRQGDSIKKSIHSLKSYVKAIDEFNKEKKVEFSPTGYCEQDGVSSCEELSEAYSSQVDDLQFNKSEVIRLKNELFDFKRTYYLYGKEMLLEKFPVQKIKVLKKEMEYYDSIPERYNIPPEKMLLLPNVENIMKDLL